MDGSVEHIRDVRARLNQHSDAVTHTLSMNAQKPDLSDSEEDGSSSASETDASDTSPVSILPSMHVGRGMATVVQMKPTPGLIDYELSRKGEDYIGYGLSLGELIGMIHCGRDDLYRAHGTTPIPPLVTTI